MTTMGAAPHIPQLVDGVDLEAYLSARRRERFRGEMLPIIGLVGMVLLWWVVVSGFHVRPFIAPSPLMVVRTIFNNYKMLLDNLVPTAVEAVGGFLIGNLAAIALATVFVHNKTLHQIFFPIAVMINSIPVVAKAPILVLIMGSGLAPKITIAALVCFFPTLVNMVKGLGSVNPQVLELMSVLSANKMQIFFKLRLFNSLPYLFSSLRIAASMCVIGAVVGEWIGATRGIGALILQATYAFDTGLLYAAILLSASLAGVLFLVVAYFERLVVVWPAEGSR